MKKSTMMLGLAAVVVSGLTVMDRLSASNNVSKEPAGKQMAALSSNEPEFVAANPLRTLRLKHFAAISERPLFVPDRKPLSKFKKKRRKTTKRVAKRKPTRRLTRVDHLKLVGVLRDGPDSIAMIRNKKNGRSTKARLEDFVEGWEVAAIDAMRVKMVRGNKAVILELYRR